MPLAAQSQVDLKFRAFSDPVRLRILVVLTPGELCVCDLMKILALPQATISRHLAYLGRAGLVGVRQERKWNFYKLTTPRSALHTKLLECLSSCASEIPGMAGDLKRANAIRKQGSCVT